VASAQPLAEKIALRALSDSGSSQKDQAPGTSEFRLRCTYVGGPLEPGGSIGPVRKIHKLTRRRLEPVP
jgi:hypothetical protein